MKGIILAGGAGTRLYPLTRAISKQLVPIYDKPMIYYPLSTLMEAGIKEILIITNPHEQEGFKRLLGDGKWIGLDLSYEVQEQPRGIAEAFIIGRDFIGTDSVVLILGDNIFYGESLQNHLDCARQRSEGATVFGYHVRDPERYGVVEFDQEGHAKSLEEKPQKPKSSYAVAGLYFYDNQVIEIASKLKPSARGELEITDVNRVYLEQKKLFVQKLGRGIAWLDTGTHESLLQASNFIQAIEERQGQKVACVEEIAYGLGYISKEDVMNLANPVKKNNYGEYLLRLINSEDF